MIIKDKYQVRAERPHKDYNDFIAQMQADGLQIKTPFNPRKFNRVHDTYKQKRNESGWYVYTQLTDIAFGAYGSWIAGSIGTKKWCSIPDDEISHAQRRSYEEFHKAALEEARQTYKQAAEFAQFLYESADPADPSHPYLDRKQVRVNDLRQKEGRLIIPVYDENGDIQTLQRIDESGKKLFLQDGKASGGYYTIGNPTDIILISEGYATADSLNKATDYMSYVAFNAGNLPAVTAIARAKHPESTIIICADNDASGAGIDFANKAAAQHHNIKVTYPVFSTETLKRGQEHGEKLTDFNDLIRYEGLDAIQPYIAVEKKRTIFATPAKDLDFDNIPRRQFLYGTHLIRKYCSATFSPGGIGKTQLVMMDAVAIATGKQLTHDHPHEEGRAWHYNLEDPMDELRRRLKAICIHHNIQLDNPRLLKNLFLSSGREQPLVVMEKNKSGEIAMPDADALYRAIRDNGISSLSIDPFVRVHYMDENSNKEIDQVINIFAQIANDTNCAIDLVHHTRKAGQGESLAGNLDMMRGASSLGSAARAARTISPMSKKEAEEFDIPADQAPWFVRIDNAKGNMSPPATAANWMQRKSVKIGNGRDQFDDGDNVGVLELWTAPTLNSNISKDQTDAIFQHINRAWSEGNPYHNNYRQEDKYLPAKVAAIASVPLAIAKQQVKIWESDGYLEQAKFSDIKGRQKSGYNVLQFPI